MVEITPMTKRQGSKIWSLKHYPRGSMEVVDKQGELWAHKSRRTFGTSSALMDIDLTRYVIKSLISRIQKNNVLWFFNFEMTPTQEEIASFMGIESIVMGVHIRRKEPIIPKNVDVKKFFTFLWSTKLRMIFLKLSRSHWTFCTRVTTKRIYLKTT